MFRECSVSAGTPTEIKHIKGCQGPTPRDKSRSSEEENESSVETSVFVPAHPAGDKAWNDKQKIGLDHNVNLQQIYLKYMFYLQRDAPLNQ